MKFISKFDFSQVQYDKTHTLNLLLQAKAPKIEVAERKPVNIIAVLDESGSMGGQKIEYVRKTLLKLIDHLTDQDTFGVVAFTTGVRCVCEPAKMSSEKKTRYKRDVGGLTAQSSTNLSGGLQMGYNLAAALDGPVRLIALTDGQANYGETNPDRLVSFIKNRPANVTVTMFGYGEDHDSALLTDMAKAGDGNYCYVKNPDDALTAFARELGGLLSCYGQDLQFTVMPTEHAQILEVLSDVDVDTLDGGAVRIRIPDIYSEETRNIVVSVLVKEQPKVFPRDTAILDLELAWQDVQSASPHHGAKMAAKVRFVREKDADKKADQEVRDQVGLCTVLRAQAAATKYAKCGDFYSASSTMDTLSCAIQDCSDSVRGLGSTVGSYYSSPTAYASNMHNNSALRSATSRQRQSGGSSDAYFTTNSTQSSLVKDFNDTTSSASAVVDTSQISLSDLVFTTGSGFNVTVSNGVGSALNTTDPGILNSQTDLSKSSQLNLSKKRSDREW